MLDCRSMPEIAGIDAVLTRLLVLRYAEGLVLDGSVRDTTDIAILDLTTYCLGAAAPANLVTHHASDPDQPFGCGAVPFLSRRHHVRGGRSGDCRSAQICRGNRRRNGGNASHEVFIKL